MSYYRICPECGCSLDPGEVCDCREKEVELEEEKAEVFEIEDKRKWLRVG